MMLYHASPVHGLTTLEPRVSTHHRPYVYAVKDPVTALLFGVRQDDFDFQISGEAQSVICECYPHAFAARYGGKSCSLYEVAEDGFLSGKTSWSKELVCESSVAVVRETVIGDVYDALQSYAHQGRLIMRRYEDTPAYRSMVEAHITDRLIRFGINLNECLNWPDERFAKHYAHLVLALQKDGGTKA